MQGFIGIFVLLFICFLLSENKKAVNLKEIFGGILCQFVLVFLFQKAPIAKDVFLKITDAIWCLKTATDAGTKFVFGYIGGGNTPFNVTDSNNLFIFAFQALPMIMVISALSMLLFHWGVLQKIVAIFAALLKKIMNIGGALCVVAAAKVFVGQTEAPLLVRPYLEKFSRSELLAVMTCGLATTSGTVLVLYSTILEKTIPNALGHIFTVTIISIPVAIIIARILIPQTTEGIGGKLSIPYKFSNSMDAIARGTTDGLGLVLNIAAMVVVMLALVELVNQMLGVFPNVYGEPITLQRILGLFMTPIAYIIGVPFDECLKAGSLLSVKVIMNEVVAFINLSQVHGELSEKTSLIMSYALCGFANISSIGIIMGTYSKLIPDRNKEVVGLCFKALFGGVIATCISGAVIGILYSI